MLACLLIICASFAAVSVALTGLVGEYLFNLRAVDEMRAATALAQRADTLTAAGDMDGLTRLLRGVDGARALTVDADSIVACDGQSQLDATRLIRREITQALATGQPQSGYYVVSDGGDDALTEAPSLCGLYAVPIQSGGALVYITISETDYDALAHIRTRIYAWLGLVALCVAVLSLFVSRYFTAPLRSLERGIDAMTRGDFSARVPVRGKSEFAQLAVAFNMMCDRIENLDKARGQFVSNASHELRTPLSTMKILIQTLMYQDPMDADMTREFLGDINREIDRLNSVISDLLTLVSVDGDKSLRTEPLNIGDTLEETVKLLQPLSREKGIEMTLALRDAVTVMGDEGRLQQVFYNLIDNAIKYTGRGGHVRVELVRRDHKAVVRVTDTGIGIPKEDQQHIFDRFYRVDKARSRETGGTGLGLSIVKQIVLMHGGVVDVSSDGAGKGSAFVVELPEADGRP